MRTSKSFSGENRRGVECVEAAVTLPLLTIIFFATIQLTHHWHVEKLLKIASYEAMKVGATSSGTQAEAEAIFDQHTRALGIANAQLQFSGPSLDSANVGDLIICMGTAPVSSNQFPSPINLSLSDTMPTGMAG